MLLGLAALSLAPVTAAATLEIAYPSVERMIVQNLMTDGGRYYMEGDASTPCKYAFVQEPRVSAFAGRLNVTLLFSGKAALEVAGRCVGAGDNFEIHVSGKPAFANAEIYLEDLRLDSPDSAYFKLVAGLLRSKLDEKLRFSAKQVVDFIAAQSTGSGVGTLSVDKIRVDGIRADDDALNLSIDFAASLRP